MSQTAWFQICSRLDVPIRQAIFSGAARMRVFQRRLVAFTRTKHFENPLSKVRKILSGVKKCWRAEKLVFLVRNDNLLLENALLFGDSRLNVCYFCSVTFLHAGEDFSNFRKWISKIFGSGESYESPLENAHTHVSWVDSLWDRNIQTWA